jgi:hypothetical protein
MKELHPFLLLRILFFHARKAMTRTMAKAPRNEPSNIHKMPLCPAYY